ncbi:MAG: HAMP domain-containing histidine kinase [Nitrospirae bacterium]|nr:HAMP domain-containing histidine kinase [Nitrospirota bacterium]
MGTLFGRLSLALFTLVCLIGWGAVWEVTRAGERSRQEAVQRLNLDLAPHLVRMHAPLMAGGAASGGALGGLFHELMQVNPAIEVYLLGADGAILAFSAPPERVRLAHVNLAPVRRLLSGAAPPVRGDDPRHPGHPKIFSAAEITEDGATQGYLYVILAGEAAQGALDMARDSHLVRRALLAVGVALAAALGAGLLLIGWLTRRLARLNRAMQAFMDAPGAAPEGYAPASGRPDEIDRLGATFNRMAARITGQMAELAATDQRRRELVANVSHDLRTPLTTLVGYLETVLVKDAELSPAQRQEYLKTALGHGERLRRLVGDLFELARLDATEALAAPEPFAMGELLQDVAAQFRLAAEARGIRIDTRFGDGVPFAVGDIGLIQRVLENLIGNALRHTPDGGTVTLSLAADADTVRIQVADTGAGIPPNDLERIFGRFQRGTAEGGGGAGLGLAIVRRIVALHHGTVKAENREGGGAAFTVALRTAND